jgi:hypothetical protein
MSRTRDDASGFQAVRTKKVTGLPMRWVPGRDNKRLGMRNQRLFFWT